MRDGRRVSSFECRVRFDDFSSVIIYAFIYLAVVTWWSGLWLWSLRPFYSSSLVLVVARISTTIITIESLTKGSQHGKYHYLCSRPHMTRSLWGASTRNLISVEISDLECQQQRDAVVNSAKDCDSNMLVICAAQPDNDRITSQWESLAIWHNISSGSGRTCARSLAWQ